MLNEKKHQAKTLFFQSELNNSQIASLLNVSRRSISTWVKEGDWNRLKQSAKFLPSMLAENCYHIIGHLTESYLSESRMTNPITFKEIEGLHRLTLTAKKLQNRCTLNENMELFGYFMEMVSQRNPELARTIHPYIDEFISARASVYTQHIQPDTFNSMGRIPVLEVDNTEAQLDRQEAYLSDPDLIEAYKQWGIPHPYDEQPSSDEPSLPTTNEETSGTEPQNTQVRGSLPADRQVGRSAQFLGSKMKQTSHTPNEDQQIPHGSAQKNNSVRNQSITFPVKSSPISHTSSVREETLIKTT